MGFPKDVVSGTNDYMCVLNKLGTVLLEESYRAPFPLAQTRPLGGYALINVWHVKAVKCIVGTPWIPLDSFLSQTFGVFVSAVPGMVKSSGPSRVENRAILSKVVDLDL